MRKQEDSFLLILAAGVVIMAATLILAQGAGWGEREVRVAGAKTQYTPK